MKLTTVQPSRHPDPTTKASALAYLIFDRPDLEKAEQFLNDFGLRTVSRTDALVLLRGTGASHFCYVVRKAPKSMFVGFGLQVDNMADPPMHLWQDPECAGDSWTEVESPDSSADEP